jgi:CTP-dependent riboflavin kinase
MDWRINLVRCRINDVPAFVFRTDRADAGTGMCPKTTVEVLADVRLRHALDLRDGDEVRLELPE